VSGVEHINKIDDEIISLIRKSKFLVADFTGHRGGVYFEAGFALGLGLPVFWTCRKDDLKNLHFDIRQYNCIDWADTVDLATRLSRELRPLCCRKIGSREHDHPEETMAKGAQESLKIWCER
jgi:nucleoside 2-deoxyribosyltransferase